MTVHAHVHAHTQQQQQQQQQHTRGKDKKDGVILFSSTVVTQELFSCHQLLD